jgi:hypothetical protein
LAVVIAVRVVGAAWLFYLLSPGGKFHTPWMDANPRLIPEWSSILNPSASSDWLWLFNAWDSPHFQLIAQSGYTFPDYAYLPGYPIFIRMAGLIIGNYWLGGLIVTQVFALASVVAFQSLAEQHMNRTEALCATLLMATFPYVSVFTTLAYSEAVFLFSSVSAWYLYRKGRLGASSLLAGLASVTRIYGIAIVLPILLEIVKSKQYRKLIYLTVPAGFLGSWLLFCYFSTGDPFATLTDEKWFTSNIASHFGLIQTIMNQLFRGLVGAVAVPFYIDPPILIALCLFVYLIVKTCQVDASLSVYAVALFVSVILVVTNHLSMLRYFAFIFPIWLTVRTRNLLLVTACVILFSLVTWLLWLYAISVTFIG